MIGKKFIVAFGIILLVISIGLQAMRTEFTFKAIENKDVFGSYESSKAESSQDYDSVSKQNQEKFLVLYNSDEVVGKDIGDNVENVLSDMKKEVDYKDIKDFKGSFEQYYCVVLAFQDIHLFNYFDKLFEYVQNGGRLIFAEAPSADNSQFATFYRKFGIYEKSSEKIITGGIKLKSNILIKGENIELKDEFQVDAIPVHLEDSCKVYAVSSEDIPLIWENNYGKGRLMFVNGSFLQAKQNRGLFAGLVSSIDNIFIYPIINSKLIFIDDFPAPIPEGRTEIISKEFNVNNNDFFKNIWWPDMLRLSKPYNSKYSAYFIESYNDMVNGDFASARNGDNIKNLRYFGRELLKSNGEIGIHGYNHQPLALDGFIKEKELGYKPWKSVEDMASANGEINALYKSIYNNYALRSYVPPSNILSPEGRAALKLGLPDLKVISSLYTAAIDEDAYVQEFDMGEDGILNLPRISSGYKMSDLTRWEICNGVTTHGVISHFVHPDDLLDSERSNNEGWGTLEKNFEQLMSEVNHNFGWLNSSTISEGAVELKRYLDSSVTFKHEQNGIRGYIKDFKNHMYFILRSENKISDFTGCAIKEIDKGVYLVRADKVEFYVGMGDK